MDASNSSTSMLAGGMDAAACSNTEREAPWTACNSQAGAVASGAAKAGTDAGTTATTTAIEITTGIAIGKLRLLRKGPLREKYLDFSVPLCLSGVIALKRF